MINDASFGSLVKEMGLKVFCRAFFTSFGDFSSGLRRILVLTCKSLDIFASSSSIFFFSTAKARSLEMPRPKATGLWLDFLSMGLRPTGLEEFAR